jgi:hypothetical protein
VLHIGWLWPSREKSAIADAALGRREMLPVEESGAGARQAAASGNEPTRRSLQ